ncbi:GNAT acetyltransferase-like protein [Thermolongibacillus altinsuensis]|uniref:GNAT acetyltransferase-like protein n=1 Tax=Thermolongibacillus altinsuensis TaxID=575256 RepID=A0A4V2Q9X6_9BACL|nr:GNAT family N-acetyltransferase [Thermolongibacillus altinsuensis]TCL45795.1 GNAT acetyltransferase-like protein [Thermolongibacillus altinsuensis]
MEKLKDSEYKKVLPLINDHGKTCPTFAYSVLYSMISGVVYVDNLECPKTVLIGTSSGIYYIAGDEANHHFNKAFQEFYQKKDKKARFTLFSSTKRWDEVINKLFEDETVPMKRYSFSFNPNQYSSEQLQIPNEFNVKRIDEHTIKNSLEFNQAYYEEYWGSVSNFLANGFGYCILHNETVASECTSIFVGNAMAEIDIATNKEYRGNGFAFVTAKAFIDHCLQNGFIPRWDCDVHNLASIKLAEKLGFDHPAEYSIFVRKTK